MAASAAFLLLASLPAHACVVCLPYPQKTSADHVIEGDTAVFARESPARPFTYQPVETFKGRYDGDPIPLLLDVTTARTLQLDPSLRVIVVRDGPDGTWSKLGIAGREYQAVMRDVAAWDAKTATERAIFLAPYLQHQGQALAELAFLEVARAPYATIRDLETDVGRDDIYRVINDWFRVEWHPLYILMLGMSDRPDDIAFVRGKLATSAKYGLTTNLGAYATALIEMTGTEAVEQLASEYFTSPRHTGDELREVVKALSVQGNGGRSELRTAIIDAYGELLTHRPELAGSVANDLFDWKVARFAPRMRDILDGNMGLDGSSELAVAMYLSINGDSSGGKAAAVTSSGGIE